jgi:DNA-binding MarR family transcriptional regulator
MEGMAGLTNDEALALARHLRLTISRLRRVVRGANPAETVTRPQENALGWLERKGPLTTAELARWEQVRPQTMGSTVSDLVNAGLIVKAPDPTDGRREIISLTRDGWDRLREIVHARDRDFARLLTDKLTVADQRTLERAMALLDSLAPERNAPPG